MKTEIRIQAEVDPVLEETKRFRELADEVDTRYEKYDRLLENKQEQ
ncbi:hypothetical protein [Paenibacillus hexagrammi]|uniref:Phage protein n=1 Tax=Paenibacillus hexagrammi TaxID=2908839 RepID=A0ABY3SEZ1_9BACL|nr:hypothetical protein [Paenibacillus sp. YPD9-1]UJF32372.1 hypothetical protein L0M14_22110 [Paenibacillus sp. YPD9-1]